MNVPDRWVVVKLTGPDTVLYKILAGWYGGYTGSDEWKMSSKIVDIVNNRDDSHSFSGESGSEYICYHKAYGTSGYTQSVFNRLKEGVDENYNIEILPIEQAYDFL